MLDNLKFGRKMLLGFGLVVAMVFALTMITLVTSVQRNRSLARMEKMNEFQQEANIIVDAFAEAKVNSVTAFTLMEIDDEYLNIYNYLDSALESLGTLDKLSTELGGYHKDVISEMRSQILAYRSYVEFVESNDAVLQEAIAGMTLASDNMAAEMESMFAALTVVLQTSIPTNPEMALAYVGNVLVPVQSLSMQVADLRIENEKYSFMLNQDIANVIKEKIISLEQDVSVVSAYFTTDAGREMARQAVQSVQDYEESLENGMQANAESDAQINAAMAQMESVQELIGNGTAAVMADVQDIILDIENQALITAVLNVVIASVIIIFSILMAVIISRSVKLRLRMLQELLLQVGESGDMNFSDATKAEVLKAAKSKDELGESLLAFATTMEHLIKISANLQEVADGNLNFEVEVLGEKDTMGNSLKSMLDNLNDMFHSIDDVARQVASSSNEVATGAQSLAQGATEQASTIEEISASIGEIAEQASNSAQKANDTVSETNRIRQIADEGGVKMNNMMAAVQEISDASTSIEKVIKVIDDIAFQTNILALNAAVEAARAGEHGKGFAVVADEVRSLAGKSQEAAQETAVLIQASVEKSRLGLEISQDTAQSLQQITEGVQSASVSIEEMAQESTQSQAATSQVNDAVDQVALVVQQNSATSEESAAASQEMNGQAQMLQDLVARFKLKDAAKGAGNSQNVYAHANERTAANALPVHNDGETINF